MRWLLTQVPLLYGTFQGPPQWMRKICSKRFLCFLQRCSFPECHSPESSVVYRTFCNNSNCSNLPYTNTRNRTANPVTKNQPLSIQQQGPPRKEIYCGTLEGRFPRTRPARAHDWWRKSVQHKGLLVTQAVTLLVPITQRTPSIPFALPVLCSAGGAW